MSNEKVSVCKKCQPWVLTSTLLSTKKVWHCKYGFLPYTKNWGSCKQEAERNLIMGIKLRKKHPELFPGYAKQLELMFE